MMETIIYGLIDPRTCELRYVGKTSQGIKQRMKEHRLDAVTRNKMLYSSKWLRTVFASGSSPLVEIFENVVAGGDWVAAEKRWIAHWKSLGAKLTNLTDGGEGLAGTKRPQRVIDAVKAAHIGRKASEECREKMRSSWTQERREKTGALRRGVPWSAEQKAKASASQRKKRLTDEHKANIGKSQKGKIISSEHRAKLSAAWTLERRARHGKVVREWYAANIHRI